MICLNQFQLKTSLGEDDIVVKWDKEGKSKMKSLKTVLHKDESLYRTVDLGTGNPYGGRKERARTHTHTLAQTHTVLN